jgi:putative glutamine amidotransferase
MSRLPLILTTPCTGPRGEEFGDPSVSLSSRYTLAVSAAGGVPWIMPPTESREVIAESVRQCGGVMLTGGNDVQPALYTRALPERLRRTVGPADGPRDLMELMVIEEVFRQRKPLLAICRGQQILNVAFGGTLVTDIASEIPKALNHRQGDRKDEIVHEVTLTTDCQLATILGTTRFGVNSSHHQSVGRVATPFRAVARSADGVIEAMELKTDHVGWLPYLVAVQFHPERLFEKESRILGLFRSFVQACVARRKPSV